MTYQGLGMDFSWPCGHENIHISKYLRKTPKYPKFLKVKQFSCCVICPSDLFRIWQNLALLVMADLQNIERGCATFGLIVALGKNLQTRVSG